MGRHAAERPNIVAARRNGRPSSTHATDAPRMARVDSLRALASNGTRVFVRTVSWPDCAPATFSRVLTLSRRGVRSRRSPSPPPRAPRHRAARRLRAFFDKDGSRRVRHGSSSPSKVQTLAFPPPPPPSPYAPPSSPPRRRPARPPRPRTPRPRPASPTPRRWWWWRVPTFPLVPFADAPVVATRTLSAWARAPRSRESRARALPYRRRLG